MLRTEAIEALDPRPGQLFLDGTFGAGGYSRLLLETPGTRVLALDRDPDAIAGGASLVEASDGRLILRAARFGDLDTAAAETGLCAGETPAFDGVVLDIGVSSMQIDTDERGFSFRLDGPLDMRMERSGPSAADLVNEADEEALADILYRYGEERQSRRIARAIVADRVAAPFTTTRALAELIARVAPAPPHLMHPATRSFQALRIAVNDELGELVRALDAAERVLKDGGRLAVVSFHSLEDRIVKQFLAAASGRSAAGSRHLPEARGPAPTFTVPGKQPVVASVAEIDRNPRARSAKLRHAVRTAAPPAGVPDEVRALAALPTQRGSSTSRRRR